MKKQIETLTEQESAFAAENHSLIFRFFTLEGAARGRILRCRCVRLPERRKKYFRREELRKQYSFTTLAWHAMNSCFANYQRSKARLKKPGNRLCIHEPLSQRPCIGRIDFRRKGLRGGNAGGHARPGNAGEL